MNKFQAFIISLILIGCCGETELPENGLKGDVKMLTEYNARIIYDSINNPIRDTISVVKRYYKEGFIEQYGLGAASEFMVKLCGTYTITQGIVYILLLIMSPVGAWSVFAFGTIQATLFLIYGYTTVNGKWAQVDGVKATAEGYIVPAILLVFHLYIMFTMSEIIYA